MSVIDLYQLTSKSTVNNNRENAYGENSLLAQRLQSQNQSQRKELREIGESERNISTNSRVRADKLNRSKL